MFRSIASAALLAAASALPAQEGGEPAAQPPAGQNPAASGVPQDKAAVYGRVVVDGARLRCWPSAVAKPPVFEDVLNKGTIVRLGESRNGFRMVMLPLGPIGYVAQRFTVADDSGNVSTKGTGVAFRYRPRTSEAPVTQLPDATPLHVISLADGWYRARVAGVEAWLANAEVEVVPSDPEIVAAYEKLGETMQQEVQARLDAIAAEKKRKEQERADLEAIAVVEQAFARELQKEIGEQQFEPLQKALAKVVAGLAEDSGARAAAAALQKRIQTQQWIQEASVVTKSEPPKVEQPKVEEPKDRLERFESIGWLRYESGVLGSPGVYYIEKGGRRQLLVTCNNGRFDLALFVGREVGVIGPRRSPLNESLSVLDVERIEVLGSAGQ